MKTTIESVGKNVSEAIEEGIKKLGVSKDDVDIKIISQGGLFKKAKVELTIERPDIPVREEVVKSEPKTEKASVNPPKAEVKAESKPGTKQEIKSQPKQEKKAEAKQEKPEHKAVVNTEAGIEKPIKTEKENPDRNNNNGGGNNGKNNKKNDNRHKYGDKDKDGFKKHEDKPRESAPVTQEHIDTCVKFIDTLLGHMGIQGKAVATSENGINIDIQTEDSSVIGYRGEVLDSIQYLTSIILSENGGKNVLLSVNALSYREKRIDILRNLANKTAEKAIRLNKKVSLEPMNSADRRIIHAALQDNEQVITRSEGNEPTRRVAVLPTRQNKTRQEI